MTYRHHAASLEATNGDYATYRYTLDSVDEKYFGRIRFRMADGSYEVLECADGGGSREWQESVCMALSNAFKRARVEQDDRPPEFLHFVA